MAAETVPGQAEWYYKVEPYSHIWPWKWKVTLYHNKKYADSTLVVFESSAVIAASRMKKKKMKDLRKEGYVRNL